MTEGDHPGVLGAALIEFAESRAAAMAIARRELKLSDNDARALSFVLEHPSCRINELATRLQISSAATTTLVDRLESRDLIRRHADGDDRRAIRLTATSHATTEPWSRLTRFDERVTELAGEESISADALRDLARRAAS